MREELIRATAGLLSFLELATEDQVEPDLAVEQMEIAAAILGEMSITDKLEFVRVTKMMADEEAARGGSAERVSYLRNVGDYLGITH